MNTKPYGRFAAALAVAATLTMANVQAAGEHVGPATEFAKTTVAKWISSPDLITAIKAQNARHAVLTESQIDSLDKQWRAEVGASNRPLIDEILARPASKILADIKKERRGTGAGNLRHGQPRLERRPERRHLGLLAGR